MSKKLIIAVDGPAGSGKSTTFQVVADRLGYQLIDTGLMYRAFTFFALQKNIDFEQPQALISLIPYFNYQLKKDRIYLNHQDVTEQLSSHEVVEKINKVTKIPEIRAMMVALQRKMAVKNLRSGLIMIGRDITSVVLPNADLKIYLDSSIERRAQRRLEQNHQETHNLKALSKEIAQRDFNDQHRTVGPLKRTKDSWYIDNSKLSLEETVTMVTRKINELEQ